MRQIKNSTRLRVLAAILALGLILTPAMGGTVAGIIARTQCIINTFLSGLAPDGSLVIRKEVTHPFPEDYLLPAGLSFPFAVSFGTDYAGATIETSQGDFTADENGTILLNLAPGEAVRMENIREGTAVTVTEEPAPGFSPDGGPTRTVTIGSGDGQLTYVNIYAPAPADPAVTVTGTKLLEGRDWQEGDRFSFNLEYRHAGTETGWQTLGTADVAYDPENPDFDRFDLTDLLRAVPFDQAGTYAFRVSEVSGEIGGIVYDKVVSYFDILVGDDDMDGALEIQNVTGYQNAAADFDSSTGTFRVEVTICNRYIPGGTADVTIPIQKTVESLSGAEQSLAGYTFELYDEWGTLVAVSEETSAAGEIAMTLTYGAEDAGKSFHYILSETGAGETHGGMTFDSRSYPITVTVTDNLDGTIRAELVDLPERFVFENRYDPEDTEAVFQGTKELLGRDLRAGEFTFALYETDSSFQITGKPIQTAVNGADGTFTFDPIPYDRVGTYRYALRELPDDGGGITYDGTVYQITVTVLDDGGILWADVSVTDALGSPAELHFRNLYHPEAITVALEGRKRLYGAELATGQFRFGLYQSDENWQKQGAPQDEVSHNIRGEFAFEDLTFTEPGTWYYVIEEDTSRQIENISYDDRAYGVRITVTDDGAGSLLADVVLTELGGGEVDAILFENTYTAPTEPTEPTVPTEPTEPTTPTIPTEPSEPTVPTDPSVPTEPSDPTEPTEDTGEPGKPNKPSAPDHPETGDSSGLEFYILLTVLSGTVFLLLLFTGNDRKKE